MRQRNFKEEGAELQKKMSLFGITSKELSERIACSHSLVNYWLNGTGSWRNSRYYRSVMNILKPVDAKSEDSVSKEPINVFEWIFEMMMLIKSVRGKVKIPDQILDGIKGALNQLYS
jgi:hypothetical protein